MSYSPWGPIDHTEHIIPGVDSVSTPRHGGIRVTAEKARELSAAARAEAIQEYGFFWFEEDCDWAIVAYEFEDAQPSLFSHAVTRPEDWREELESSLRTWNLAYALKVGIVTVDALPARYYCPSRVPCDRKGLQWIASTRTEPGRVICKSCGTVIYTVGQS